MTVFSHIMCWSLLFALLTGSICSGKELARNTVAYSSPPKKGRKQEEVKPGGGQQPTNPGLIIEKIKVATDGDLVLLPIEIRQKRYLFALDTGSSIGIYDTCFRCILGDPIRSEKIRGPGQHVTVPVFRSPKGTVGKLTLPADSECFCIDLGKVREMSGQEVYGCLGMDFLKKLVFRIDFDCGEVTILPNVDSNAGKRIPIIFQGDDPYVMVDARGLERGERFLVDTGFSGFISGNIRKDDFENLARMGFIKLKNLIPHESWVGKRPERLGLVNGINLSGFRHENLLFSESNQNILGLGYWSRYVLTFDFPNSVMYIKKGRQFDRPEFRDRSGLDMRRIKGLIVIASVGKDSASAKAGIKAQDVILKINDSKISLFRIRRLFCERGKMYRLLIRRGNKDLTLTMLLED